MAARLAPRRRVRTRNGLAHAWLKERRRRAAAKPTSLARQAALGAGLLIGLAGATVWLGGFADEAAARAGRMTVAGMMHAGFTLEHVEVRGARRARADEVAAQLMAEPGAFIFDFDPRAAKSRVEALPWVSDVAVLRLLPDRVVVMVEEREPLARWDAPEGVVVLDEEGGVIRGAEPAAYLDLPLLEGEAAPAAAGDLVDALARHPALARRAAAFERVGGRRWDMRTNEGIVVRLPEDGLAAALDELDALQARDGVLDLPLALVDLRGQALVMRPRALPRAGFERGA